MCVCVWMYASLHLYVFLGLFFGSSVFVFWWEGRWGGAGWSWGRKTIIRKYCVKSLFSIQETLPNIYSFSFFFCVDTCVHVYGHVWEYIYIKCMHACRSQRLPSGVFLLPFTYFLRQVLSPNLELTNLARTADWQAPSGPPISVHSAPGPELEWQAYTTPGIFGGFWGSKLRLLCFELYIQAHMFTCMNYFKLKFQVNIEKLCI